MSDYTLLTAFLFLDNEVSAESKGLLQKCFKGKRYSYRSKLNGGDFYFSESEKKDIEKIWLQLDTLKSQYDRVLEIGQASEKFSLIEAKKYSRALEGCNELLCLIGRSIIYSQVGNQGRFKENLAKAINLDPSVHFRLHPIIRHEVTSLDNILKLIKKLASIKNQSRLIELLILKLSYDLNPKMQSLINQNFSVLGSRSEILRLAYSSHYGARYPNLWIPLLEQLFGLGEVRKYARNLKVSRLGVHELSFLKHVLPRSDEDKELLKQKFVSSFDSKEEKNLYSALSLLEGEIWGRYLAEDPSLKLFPLAKTQRKIYLEIYELNRLSVYSTLSLLGLGDLKREYWIQLFAMRTYGLSSAKLLPL